LGKCALHNTGLCKQLAKCEGSKIVISARRESELQRVKTECLDANPGLIENSIFVLPLDMTDYSQHEPAFRQVLDTFGKLDILISNAGRSQRAKWHEIETEVDKQLFDLNVFSLVNLNRIVVRHFLQTGRGQLAVMSSLAGKIGLPNSCTYTGSKFALHGYFESLRNEIRNTKIKITIICPGPVFSNFLKEAFTSHAGEKVNQKHSSSDKRMTADRCGYLSLVGIANKLEEIWVSPFPMLPFTYLAAYQPFIYSIVTRLLNSSGAFAKMRDNRDVMQSRNE